MPLYDADPTTAQILAPVLMQFFQAKQAAEQREQQRRLQEEQINAQAELRRQQSEEYAERTKRQKLLEMAKERYLGAPEMTQPESLMMPFGTGGQMVSGPTIPAMPSPERRQSLQRLQTLDPQYAYNYEQIDKPGAFETSGMASARINTTSREGIEKEKAVIAREKLAEQTAHNAEQGKLALGRLRVARQNAETYKNNPTKLVELRGALDSLNDNQGDLASSIRGLQRAKVDMLTSYRYNTGDKEITDIDNQIKELSRGLAEAQQARKVAPTQAPGGDGGKTLTAKQADFLRTKLASVPKEKRAAQAAALMASPGFPKD